MQHVLFSLFTCKPRWVTSWATSKPGALLLLMMLMAVAPSFGQAQVEAALSSIRVWIIVILNVAFLIGIGIGIFKAAMKFFTGTPDKIEFMIRVVIASALFGVVYFR
ncbi:MAG: hypothetical protein AAF944_09780 [Bacteroidota bacterium]